MAFRDLSIRKKLQLTILLPCSAALVLAFATTIAREVIEERRDLEHDLNAVADVVGTSSTAALAFRDTAAAAERLAALEADYRILTAQILDRKGAPFAGFTRPRRPGEPVQDPAEGGERLRIARPLTLDGDQIGSIVLEADLSSARSRATSFALEAGALLVASLVLALFLASALARTMSRPLLSLAETAHLISAKNDYDARAVKTSQDELGEVVDRFNQMLDQIQVRDRALRQAHDELEARIEERTAELRHREWWLMTILRSIADGVIAADRDGRVTFVNEAAEELTGRRRDRSLGLPLGEVLRLTKGQGGDSLVAGILSVKGPQTGTATLVDSTGAERPVEYNLASIPEEPDESGGVVMVFRDITVRREAEQTTTLRRLQALVHNLPAGIAFLSSDHRVMLANPAALDCLRVLAGSGVGDEIHHLGGRRVEELLEAPPGGQPHHIVTLDEGERTFEVTATVMEHEGESFGHTLVLSEVTEEIAKRRNMEQQERLAAVGQLAAGIAHDFNNMLQAITGYAELIRLESDLSKRVLRRVNDIAAQGRRGAKLIRQILDFSRKSITERQEIELGSYLAEVAKMLRQIIPESISITTDLARDGCRVLADPTQIQQLVTNLAVNARDAMPHGGQLTLRLWRQYLDATRVPPLPHMEPGEWICLSVTDTGTGIPEEVQPHIFEPFFTTKRLGEGTGLGLSQVYGIAKQQDGFIDFSSDEGRGSTFVLYLPPGPETDLRNPPSGEFPAMTAGKGRTALVVEDEPMVLAMTKEILEAYGFTVLTATNGRVALEVFTGHGGSIDLVVSDMVMPEMGGVELLKRLRGLAPTLRMIIVSGYPLGENVRGQLLLPGLQWLAKPFSAVQLGRAVVAILSE